MSDCIWIGWVHFARLWSLKLSQVQPAENRRFCLTAADLIPEGHAAESLSFPHRCHEQPMAALSESSARPRGPTCPNWHGKWPCTCFLQHPSQSLAVRSMGGVCHNWASGLRVHAENHVYGTSLFRYMLSFSVFHSAMYSDSWNNCLMT